MKTKTKSPMLVSGREGPSTTEEVVAIEYHDNRPFAVHTKVTIEWDKVCGWRPEDGKKFSNSRNDYSFEWSKTNGQLYWHNRGGGGSWKEFIAAAFTNPNPPYAQVWLAKGVRARAYKPDTRCRKMIDLSDADLLARGYERVARPIILTNSCNEPTPNPFDVADGDIDCRYCKFCDDYLPDSDGNSLCEHVVYCDDCCGWVYDLCAGHVDLDDSRAKPVRHDDDWVDGKTDECCAHKGNIRLRINGDRLETTMGSDMPIAQAASVIADIIDRRRKQLRLFGPVPKEIYAFGRSVVVKKKAVHVGCSKVAWSEIERIAGLLNGVEV